jgi:hypothetical protein
MRKRRGATPQNVDAWIRRGDGQGEGANFRPFFHVRDVPSRGRSHMVVGLRTGRTHHYLSDIEYGYHLLAEFASEVSDIREQYALLPWGETQSIASALRIRHPVYPGTHTPIVMTSDIVLTIAGSSGSRLCVVSVKPASQLDPKNSGSQRVFEKLWIEKKYWASRDVTWTLCTDEMLPKTRVRNLDLLRPAMVGKEFDRLNPRLPEFVSLFTDSWSARRPLNDMLAATSRVLGIRIYEAFALFARSVWLRLLPINLDAAVISHSFPVILENTQSEAA